MCLCQDNLKKLTVEVGSVRPEVKMHEFAKCITTGNSEARINKFY